MSGQELGQRGRPGRPDSSPLHPLEVWWASRRRYLAALAARLVRTAAVLAVALGR